MAAEKKTYWVRCPKCNAKTKVKVFETTVLINFPLYCPRCEKQYAISIIKLKMFES